MVKLVVSIVISLFIISCSSRFNTQAIEELYVQDFQTTDMSSCSTKDVNLTHAEALTFFQVSKQVNSKAIHDHYDYAPCFVEGTLKYHGVLCDWNIRAGKTGAINCKGEELYFACDECDYLFE